MSKPIRISDDFHTMLSELAQRNKRTLGAQLEMMIEQEADDAAVHEIVLAPRDYIEPVKTPLRPKVAVNNTCSHGYNLKTTTCKFGCKK